MALTLTKLPDVLSLTGNEVAFDIHSDNAYSSLGTIFSGKIDPTNFNLAFGTFTMTATITFTWGSHTLTLKNKNKTLISGWDYIIYTDQQLILQSFIDALNRDYYFSRDFNVVITAYGSPIKYRLDITAKSSGADYDLSCVINNGWSVITAGTDKTLRENYRIGWQVQVYNATTLTWDDMGEVQLESVDEDGDISIDVSEFLQRDVSGHFTWPQIYTNNMSAVDIVDTFRVKYMEYYGATPLFYPVAYSTPSICIQGRISQLRMASIIQQGLTYYKFLTNSEKPLTFAPKEKLISIKQRELLYYFCPIPLTSIRLYVKAYYTDGTTSADTMVKQITAAAGTTFVNTIIEIFCGYSATGVGLIDANKTVSKYQVWLTNSANGKIMEIRTFLVDQRYNEYERYFVYRNKLGLYEIFRTTGISFANLRTEKGFIKVPLNGDYDITERSTKQSSVEKEVSITQNSGFIEDINIINYISEFLESADAYFCDNKYAYPITIIPGTYALYQDKSGLYSFEFDYQFALEADSTEEFLIATRKGSFNSSFNTSFL